jgi:type III pantothenate kinase
MLLLDRGNTCLKWQLIAHNDYVQKGIADNEVNISAALSELDVKQISEIWVSSVSNQVFEKELIQWAQKNSISEINFVHSEAEAFGLKNSYADPQQLGVDRWLAMLGARKQYQGMLCVVDCGTACTLDLVASDGQHIGGFIVPGMSLMAKSLLSNTQRIAVEEYQTDTFLGKNTSQAVMLGVKQSLRAFIQQTLLDIEGKYKEPVTLIITGGDCNNLAMVLNVHCNDEPDLVFKGLQCYAEQAK